MAQGKVIIPRVWRAEILRVILFVVLSIVSIVLSLKFPGSIISGKLFTLGGQDIILSLPLFWLLPLGALASAFYRIHNVRYSMDAHGLESRVGILSLNQVTTRIRFEDIRSIETDQTLIGRLLDVGTVEMGTAATAGLEMVFDGVSAPRELQLMIEKERDVRLASQPKEVGADQSSGEGSNEISNEAANAE